MLCVTQGLQNIVIVIVFVFMLFRCIYFVAVLFKNIVVDFTFTSTILLYCWSISILRWRIGSGCMLVIVDKLSFGTSDTWG